MHAEQDKEALGARVPRVAADVDPTRLPLSPQEGYLLSRVDGKTPWSVLCGMGPLDPETVDRLLSHWLDEGILILEGQKKALSRTDGGPRAPEVDEPALVQIDPQLEIPVDIQRGVVEFLGLLDRPYHEILGVSADADTKTLKRAYFGLSKRFHPDRYFRRRTGPFAPLLEKVFKKVVEAYELLSDPTARAEVQRSLSEEAPAAASQPSVHPGSRFRRGRHVFSAHARARRERRRKAKTLFESGMAAYAQQRWLEAAAGVRLAIAFDPWNEAYKEEFANVQLKAHQERAKQLVHEAESALDLRDLKGALRHYEDALHYRPHDSELHHQAAKLAWLAESDLHQAKEYATQACELAPENGGYHRTLGQIYKEAGLEANARREFESALRIDPQDDESRAELRSLGRRFKLPISLGGRR